jgi:hypothetical protein
MIAPDGALASELRRIEANICERIVIRSTRVAATASVVTRLVLRHDLSLKRRRNSGGKIAKSAAPR